MCLVLPLFHIFGLVASLLVAMIENIKIPDETWGEIVGCALVLRPGYDFNKEDFKSALAKDIASHKIPENIVIYEGFLLLANGKVNVLNLKIDMASR